MKMIIKTGTRLFLLFLAINVSSCSDDEPTKSDGKDIKFISYQAGGCNNEVSLAKKGSFNDSCFTYSFRDTLKIDFCVWGNCCPDSNRFDTNYKISSDTLYVTVKDTAANLCRCECNYIVHVEMTGLPNDKYLFYCNYYLLEYKEFVIKGN